MKKDKLILIIIIIFCVPAIIIYLNIPEPSITKTTQKTYMDYELRFASLSPTESSLPHRGDNKIEDYQLCIKDKNYTKDYDPVDFCAWHSKLYEYSEENYNSITLMELNKNPKKEDKIIKNQWGNPSIQDGKFPDPYKNIKGYEKK